MIKLKETLISNFGIDNVKNIENYKDVFLCEKKAKNNITYQVFFIDTSEKWIETGISEYLENIVIEKYYQTEGFLQWNYYYIFITEKEILEKNIERKKEIENDEKYTRKSVLTEEEFEGWVSSINRINEISEDEISNDLYSTWVNYLRERELYFIFNSEKYPNYKQPVEDYINGLSSEDFEDVDSANEVDFSLNKIIKLELNRFRKYPLKRSFDFGLVNLIHGLNAVGKTSMYDAIELNITGNLFDKTDNSDYSKYDVNLIDNSNNILKYPLSSSIYKKRDIEWYKSGVNRGNILNRNFNKFNYYNCDFAFLLKQDDINNKNNVEDLITDIALGREVNKLEERIKSFLVRFVTSNNSFLNEITELNKKLNEKNETINELVKKQKNPQEYYKALTDSLENCFWKSKISNSDDFIAILDNEINSVQNILTNIQSKNIEFEKLSIENIKKELNDLNLLKFSVSSIKEDILKYQQQIKSNLNVIEKQKSILPIIEELSIYFKHDQISLLIGLEENIKSKNIELDKLNDIKQFADSIFMDEIILKESDKLKTIEQLENESAELEELINNKKNDTEIKIKQFENGIEELTIIVSNIKSDGKTYLKLNPEAEDCPLCETHFTIEELKKAIYKTQDAFANSIVLISLKEELKNINIESEEIKKRIETISKLKKLSSAIFNLNIQDKTFYDIQKSCNENLKKLTKLNDFLIQLNTIKSQLNIARLSEDLYLRLMKQVNEYFSQEISTNLELDEKKQILLESQNKLSADIIQLAKDLELKESKLTNSFSSEILNEEQLVKKINILQELENNYKQLEIYFNFSENSSFLSILENINGLVSVFDTYKKAINEAKEQNQVLNLVQKEIDGILLEIEILNPKQIRCNYAKDELEKLIQNHNKNQFLNSYIIKNKLEIVSIFKLIHTPLEFKDIDFTDSKISLTVNDDSKRSLNEISSGQRSALALSIFLSLNKKLTNGPNILMFDDPVIFVDDMNVLSFFDYLRELVINSKRQIFFATANDDLAFLFRKKFEFLDNEFKVFKLSRESEEI